MESVPAIVEKLAQIVEPVDMIGMIVGPYDGIYIAHLGIKELPTQVGRRVDKDRG